MVLSIRKSWIDAQGLESGGSAGLNTGLWDCSTDSLDRLSFPGPEENSYFEARLLSSLAAWAEIGRISVEMCPSMLDSGGLLWVLLKNLALRSWEREFSVATRALSTFSDFCGSMLFPGSLSDDISSAGVVPTLVSSMCEFYSPTLVCPGLASPLQTHLIGRSSG